MYSRDDLVESLKAAEVELNELETQHSQVFAEYRRAEAKVQRLSALLAGPGQDDASLLASEALSVSKSPTSKMTLRRQARTSKATTAQLRWSAKQVLSGFGALTAEELYAKLPLEIRVAMERIDVASLPVTRMLRYLSASPDFAVHARTNKISLAISSQDDLENWIEECQEAFVEKRAETREHGGYGLWSVAYIVNTLIEPPEIDRLREILRKIKLPYTGWAVWFVPTSGRLPIYPVGDAIECWLDNEWDFWRVSRLGKAYMTRPFQEDFLFSSAERKKEFDLTIPVWRIGECLMHAKRLTEALAPQGGPIIFKARWEGLSGRKLVNRANPARVISSDRIAVTDFAEHTISVDSSMIEENLTDTVQAITRPLYAAFDFYALPREVVEEELTRMVGSTVGSVS